MIQQITTSGAVRWMLSALYVNGKRKREFFTDLDSANLRLQTLQTAQENTGTLVGRIAHKPEHAADAARAADLLTPFGLTLLEVAREYVDCRMAVD